MKIASFKTEHFFAQYEFTTPYQLCNSDCETIAVEELLQMADYPWNNSAICHWGIQKHWDIPN